LQDKEKLLTDLRKVLSITNDQHYHFRQQLATASQEVLQDMSNALAVREAAIQRHIALIHQLEDDTLCKRDPLKFCQMLTQELEMTEAKINSELRALKADEDADA